MWTRRDWVSMAAGAVASCGLMVAAFYPAVAHAVDERAGETTTAIAVPTLNLVTAQVSAQLDKADAHRVVVTIRNTTAQATTAEFTAQAQIYGPQSPLSRGISVPMTVWSENCLVELKPGETKTLELSPSEKAFAVADSPAAQANQPAMFGMVPGRSTLVLVAGKPAAGQLGGGITALTLAQGKAPAAPAAPMAGKSTP